MAKAPEKFEDLSEDTRQFLSELGVDDAKGIQSLIKAIKCWRVITLIMHFFMWFIGGLVTFLVASWELTKATSEFFIWWKGGVK